jgi:hypothetical protein
MAEQRQAHKDRVKEFLKNLPTDLEMESTIHLTPGQMEWLLQVLNDVRVGTWVNLGRPDAESKEKLEPTEENLRGLAMMELCGFFQMTLLEAMESKDSK